MHPYLAQILELFLLTANQRYGMARKLGLVRNAVPNPKRIPVRPVKRIQKQYHAVAGILLVIVLIISQKIYPKIWKIVHMISLSMKPEIRDNVKARF